MNQDKLLQVKNLTTSFRVDGQYYAAVDDVSFDVNKDEVFAIVGESGCGKSAMALSLARLHNLNYTKLSGEIILGEQNLFALGNDAMRKVRGNKIGFIFQDPLTALNPLHRVGRQIEESLIYHTNLGPNERKAHALELLTAVGMVDPERTYEAYPHELSGGMRQRVMIAIAISCDPDCLIADEPTTALDVTIQAQILDLLTEIRNKTKQSMILITHDLGVVAEMADRVAVMYAGQIVETGTVLQIFENPKHPYTRSLLHSIPSATEEHEFLQTIQGIVPTLQELPRTGCRFAPRIPWIAPEEHETDPVYHEVEPGHKVLCTCFKTFRFE